jgi:hypothetical protein
LPKFVTYSLRAFLVTFLISGEFRFHPKVHLNLLYVIMYSFPRIHRSLIVSHVFFFISGELHHGCSFFIRFLATTDQGRDLLGRHTQAAISRPFTAPSRAPRDAL